MSIDIGGWLNDFAPQRDGADWGIATFLLAIVALGVMDFSWPPVTGVSASDSLAILTACTVFYGQYRLRHPDKATRPAVRPEYGAAHSDDLDGYGLKNFGPGPALYLQIKVSIDGDGRDYKLLRPKERPTHLTEGKYVSLTDPNSRGNERSLASLVRGKDDDAEIRFHYTYLSQSGVREPLQAKQVAKGDSDDILDEFPLSEDSEDSEDSENDSARSIEVRTLRGEVVVEREQGTVD
ncbi:hypothetical protein [Haloarcula sp. JP-L23]|uniref:hypothetical protein n=1 Tax=Haloarcula sp. JP-L23 TaxID=2716717 RepID=UPI00140ED8AB|nr:hypothetical protein G9465_16495 [Haloarcula sp. JP-L23]